MYALKYWNLRSKVHSLGSCQDWKFSCFHLLQWTTTTSLKRQRILEFPQASPKRWGTGKDTVLVYGRCNHMGRNEVFPHNQNIFFLSWKGILKKLKIFLVNAILKRPFRVHKNVLFLNASGINLLFSMLKQSLKLVFPVCCLLGFFFLDNYNLFHFSLILFSDSKMFSWITFNQSGIVIC